VLVAHGYSDEDIEKVVGGNILRVLGEVWVSTSRRRPMVASRDAERSSPKRTERMGVVNAVITSSVTLAVGVILAWLGKGRFDAQDRRTDRLEERLDHRIDGLQTLLDGVRSDLTQIALAVGVRLRAGSG
jgi:hypothetical protein